MVLPLERALILIKQKHYNLNIVKETEIKINLKLLRMLNLNCDVMFT